MISILLGPDSYTKREYANQAAEKLKAEVVTFGDGSVPALHELAEQNLFSKPKVFFLAGSLGVFAADEKGWERLKGSANHIMFSDEKADKRVAAIKQALADKGVTVKDFPLPHGQELNRWLEARIKQLGGSIEKPALELLAKRLGRDQGSEVKFGGKVVEVKEAFDLWQANTEVEKLVAAAGGDPIPAEAVQELVAERGEVDVFSIINTIGEGDRLGTIGLIQKFLASQTGSDEKGSIIQLNALLADQFRNILITQGFLRDRLPESVILEKTGWKSGRLFIMKKNASRFPEIKVRDFLGKLEHLDTELKTSSTPPKVLLDLIVSQLL